MAQSDDAGLAAPDIASAVFDTRQLPSGRRFQAFRDFATPVLGPDYSISDPSRFQCIFELSRMRGMTGFRVGMSELGDGLTADLTPVSKVSADTQLVLHVCEHGAIGIDQASVQLRVEPHDAMLAPMRGGRMFYSDGTCFSAVLVDRGLLDIALGGEWPAKASVFGSDNAYLRLVRTWLASSGDAAASHDRIVAGTYERIAVDLIALMLGAGGERRAEIEQTSGRIARTSAIIDNITAQSQRHDLTAAQIARQLGISDRYVRRLLEETGKTFSEHLLEARLRRAHALLTDKRHVGRPVSEIAFAVGFNDLSYFYRTFRRRFGETPQGVRQSLRDDRA